MKSVIVLFGPPGSGKGTQANLLASKLDLVHFDSGRYLNALVHDPERLKEKKIREAKKIYEAGEIMPTEFILSEVERETKRLFDAESGIVFSGSPRLIAEAEAEVPMWEKLYGKKNVFFFRLKIPAEVSIARNSKRLLCRVCGNPFLAQYSPVKNPKHCFVCGGELYRRKDDDKKVIPQRLEEYKNRTMPILAYVKKQGHKIYDIDGTPAPYKVFESILKKLKSK